MTRFLVGDEVFELGKGSFADYAVAPEGKLARKPADVTEQAAAVPGSAATALPALTGAGRVGPGQKVLFTGASGGVGSYAIQLGKAFGAHVAGVSGAAKSELVRSPGADHVMDYTAEDFAHGSGRYDLIVDIAGNLAISQLRRAIAPAGTAIIVAGEEAGSWTGGMNRQPRALLLSPFLRQRLVMLTPKQRASDFEHLTEFIEAGTVTPSIERVQPLGRVAEAMQHLAAGQARGKVVITTESGAVPQSASGSTRPEGA